MSAFVGLRLLAGTVDWWAIDRGVRLFNPLGPSGATDSAASGGRTEGPWNRSCRACGAGAGYTKGDAKVCDLGSLVLGRRKTVETRYQPGVHDEPDPGRCVTHLSGGDHCVLMEATSYYWRAVLLPVGERGFDGGCLVNARHVKKTLQAADGDVPPGDLVGQLCGSGLVGGALVRATATESLRSFFDLTAVVSKICLRFTLERSRDVAGSEKKLSNTRTSSFASCPPPSSASRDAPWAGVV